MKESFFYLSSNNIVRNNVIVNNSNGISLYFSNNNVVSDNVISENSDGIRLYDSSDNNISGNVISNNSIGVTIFSSSNSNLFCTNNFYDRIKVSAGTINFWYYKNEGNYWADYTGQDANYDGIGDEIYRIDVFNRDNHPLMGVFSKSNTTFKGKTYSTTFISNSTICAFRFKIGEETGNKIMYFNFIGENETIAFCRIAISTELMNVPLVLLDGEEELLPHVWKTNDTTKVYLYFTVKHNNQTIKLISSKGLYLYNQLLTELQKLQIVLDNLNISYHYLMNNYPILLSNHSQLQQNHLILNSSYHEQLTEFSIASHNLRYLTYVFAVFTAVFLLTTIYLSKNAYASSKMRTEENGDVK